MVDRVLVERTFTGEPPWGWRRNENGRAVPCEYEQAALRKILKLAQDGLGYGEIARSRELARWHPRGGVRWVPPRRRKGNVWTRMTIRKIVLREAEDS